MIEKIHIQNFKSIYDLELEVGRVNLFIGENGSGKSNLLEALVFVSAAGSNKLDNEFLVSRGLRVPEAELMRSAFDKENVNKEISIEIGYLNHSLIYLLNHNNQEYGLWENLSDVIGINKNILDESEQYIIQVKDTDKKFDLLQNKITEAIKNKSKFDEKYMDNLLLELNKFKEKYKMLSSNKILNEDLGNIEKLLKIQNFLIYSPENTALRIFEKEKQIQPLGINGEGLLKLLKVINNYEDKSYINTIIESLQLFNWFEDITIPSDISSLEDKVIIKDKYLYREFTQRSANEGFLFILFYITLIVAKETPKAFAIDNIDASLNPKLCTKLMTILTDLAKKYDKQIFLTTHNPAILDGIDLNDEEQKLFVVSRNKKGHTRMKEITAKDKPKSSTNEPLKLSEAFLRGYLGGLPKGF